MRRVHNVPATLLIAVRYSIEQSMPLRVLEVVTVPEQQRQGQPQVQQHLNRHYSRWSQT